MINTQESNHNQQTSTQHLIQKESKQAYEYTPMLMDFESDRKIRTEKKEVKMCINIHH